MTIRSIAALSVAPIALLATSYPGLGEPPHPDPPGQSKQSEQDPGAGALEATGRGAAGATELGRPLDVLRPRAEREARQRAIEDAARALGASGIGEEAARKLVRAASEADKARWKITYHLNGSVSAEIRLEHMPR